MRTEALAVRSWDDLVFENRHKEYGAYPIRKAYGRHITIALIAIVTATLLAAILPRIFPDSPLAVVKPNSTDSGILQIEDIRITPPPPIVQPPPPPPSVAPAQTQPNLPIQVTHEEVTEVLPTNEELATANNNVDTGTPGTGIATDGEGPVTNIPEVILPQEPVSFTAVMPVYKGGFEAMSKFIGKNTKYPSTARRMELEGTVFVSFVISVTGKVIDVKVVKGISADCDKEAMRVIAMMPDWEAGRQSNDHPVPVRMVLPIKFALNR